MFPVHIQQMRGLKASSPTGVNCKYYVYVRQPLEIVFVSCVSYFSIHCFSFFIVFSWFVFCWHVLSRWLRCLRLPLELSQNDFKKKTTRARGKNVFGNSPGQF